MGGDSDCNTVSIHNGISPTEHPHLRQVAYLSDVAKSSVGPDLLQDYLDTDSVRDALHLPRKASSGPWGKGFGSGLVEQALIPDLNAPTSLPLWPSLMARGVRILVYNGNFDLICNHMGTDA